MNQRKVNSKLLQKLSYSLMSRQRMHRDLPTPLRFTVDTAMYSITALQKASYWFTGEYFVALYDLGFGKVDIVLQPKPNSSGKVDDAQGLFLNELLDQTLREKISHETEAARNLIMAHALSKTKFVEEGG